MKNDILVELINSQKNLIVNGELSSGKTKSVLFPLIDEIIKKNDSMLVLDSKEEHIKKYYDLLKEQGYNILILNIKDMEKSINYNPYSYAYNLYKNGNKDEALERVEEVNRILLREKDDIDSFWSTASSDFLTGLILGLFEDAKEEEININSLGKMIDDGLQKYGVKDYLFEYFNMKDKMSNSYVCASTTVNAPNETKGGIITYGKSKLRVYTTREKLSYLLSKTNFKYEDIINKKTAIFVISREETSYLNTIVTSFVCELFHVLYNSNIKNKFHFILDNFDSITYLDELSDKLAACISRNIKLYLITRSVDSLYTKYGDYLSKLCNIISIKSDMVEINWGEHTGTLNKEFYSYKEHISSIDYPTLEINTLNLFDIKSFVRNSSKMQKEELIVNRSIEDMVKEVDDKIKELEVIDVIDDVKLSFEDYKI